MIYFDNAATTNMNQEALNDLFEKSKVCFGNPSTSYSIGVKAKKIITEARQKIASLINCSTDDLFFTSGGTEGNNIIIQSFLRNSNEKTHIICSAIEHESILDVLRHFVSNNIEITFIKPEKNGTISPLKIEESIKESTKLICVQLINNEIGTIQPIEEIAKIAHKFQIKLHVDAVQAVGHIVVDVNKLGVGSLCASAHKFGGPKGIGFLFSSDHNIGLCFGGGQEKNVKSGTENVPSISSMSVALEQSLTNIRNKQQHITEMIEYLKRSFKENPLIVLNTYNDDYSAILSFRVTGVSNEALVNYFDMNGICVSTGSACSGNSFERSHVLKSLGLSDEEIDSTIRVSLSFENTIEECKIFIDLLNKGIALLKRG